MESYPYKGYTIKVAASFQGGFNAVGWKDGVQQTPTCFAVDNYHALHSCENYIDAMNLPEVVERPLINWLESR